MLHKCHANVLKSDASIVTHYALLRKAVGRSCRAAKQPPLRVGIDARSAGIKKWWLVSASEEHPRPRVHNFAAHTVKVWTAPSRWSGVPKLRTRSPRTF